MSRTFRRGTLAALALVAASAGAAPAQSVLATGGLGYPSEPLDARARGLGGVALGLPDASFSLVNPAGPIGVVVPGVSVTFQPEAYEATAGADATDGTTARFPAVHAVLPTRGRLAFTLAYGSFLDQNFNVTRSDSITLSTGRAAVEDRFRSVGGIARFRGGVGYRVTDRLVAAVALDAFTGAVRDTTVRTIGGLVPAVSGTTVTYTGTGLAAGARWSPLEALTVAAAVSGGGKLTADPDDSTGVASREYSLPLTLDAGASARVGRNTLLAASARWAGWGAADDDIVIRGGARDAFHASAGVEFDGFSLLRQTLPIRLGARTANLPFRLRGADGFATERAFTAGLGARLARGAGLVDAAVERGTRGGDGAGFDESYWRGTFSVTIFAR
jgi:hypothetical protein